jgi:hypothetical protein
MQKAYRQATSGLIGLAIGAGCGGSSPGTTATEPASVEYVEQSIQQSLDRLEALSIVHVGRLVLDLPAEATSCYGLPPCPGAEEPYRVERARQAPRVAHLASIAEAMRDRYVVPHDKSEAGAALEALAALNVVQVTGLVEAKPANNPECYNLPCGSDIEAADRENAKRVGQVFAIVAAAKASGL